jgi:prepilin-type N-terminal cleavage/methylation domain-containing protein
MNMKKLIKRKGFSLIELMVVISIIIVLMAIIVGVYLSAKGRRDEKKVLAEMKALELAIHNYHTEHNFFPPDDHDPDNPGSFDANRNGLFESLTQGFEKDENGQPLKNFLEGTQMKNDGNGNLVAPVDNPGDSSQPNFWQYNSHLPPNNPERYDLWVPIRAGKETLIIRNWGD